MNQSSFVNYNFFNPKLKLLSDRFDSIKEEYLLNKDKLEFKDFTILQDQNIKEQGKGYPIGAESYLTAPLKGEQNGWHMAGILYENYIYNRNGSYMPVLIETLKEIVTLNVCGINVLDSGMSLGWHNDDDYHIGVPTLRTLLGLEVPIEEGRESIIQMRDNLSGEVETKVFKENEFYCFFPSTEHRIENNLSSPRSIIAIDLLINP
jgi:hypothetical protein